MGKPGARNLNPPPSGRVLFVSLVGTRMNWWVALALVLPLTISWQTMEVGLPRLMLLSAFMLAFLLYFHAFRGERPGVGPLGPLTKVLIGVSAAFLVILAASSIPAVNKQESLYAVIRYLMLVMPATFFAVTVAREEELVPRLCRSVSMVLVIHSAVAIAQVYHLAFTDIPPPRSTLPHGLMGNRNLNGSFLVLLIPFCAYAAFHGTPRGRIFSGFALWLGTYAVVLSQTRAAWVALSAAVIGTNVLVLTLYRRFGPGFRLKWAKGMAFFGCGVVIAVMLSTAIPSREGVKDSLVARGQTLVSLEKVTSDAAFAGRLLFWRESLAMMAAHPFLGVGAGNWRIAVQRFGFYRDFGQGAGGTVPNTAHSVHLQVGAETGFTGLLVFLAGWGTVLLMGIRALLASQSNERRLLSIAALSCVCIYTVNCLANFPNEDYAQSLFVAFSIGTLAGIYEKTRLPAMPPGKPLLLQGAWLVAPAAVLVFAVYFGWVKAGFERHGRRAIGYQELKKPEIVLAEVSAGTQSLVTLAPRGFPLEKFAIRAYADLERFDEALAAAKRARALNPWHLPTLLETANVYSRMRQWDDALRCYGEILNLAPNNRLALRGKGTALYNKGFYEECRDILSKSDYQEVESAVVALGRAHLELKEYEPAARVWREGLTKYPDSPVLLENLAFVEYTHLKDLTNAYVHFQKLLSVKPDHPKRAEYTNVVNYLSRRVSPRQRQ